MTRKESDDEGKKKQEKDWCGESRTYRHYSNAAVEVPFSVDGGIPYKSACFLLSVSAYALYRDACDI
jgi:hypothetical protein